MRKRYRQPITEMIIAQYDGQLLGESIKSITFDPNDGTEDAFSDENNLWEDEMTSQSLWND